MFTRKVIALTAALLAPLAITLQADAQERTICVFDIIGTAGDQYNIMRDYATAASAHGYKLNLKV